MFNLTPTVRILLFINIGVFILQSQLGLNFLALYPFGSLKFQPWQFVTYMFMHGGIGHLLSNMFGLVSFGPLLEQRWGQQRFLTFWLVCGIGAGILYSGVRHYELNKMNDDRLAFEEAPSGVRLADFFEENMPGARGYEAVAAELDNHPENQGVVASAKETISAIFNSALNAPMVGASGALFGLLFAFAYLFPNTELMLLFLPVPIKAKYFVFLYGAYELYAGVQRAPGDNIAHFAHLSGMLVAFILLKLWERSRGQFY
ncbi:rhomboid family intramembrane serine protease [Hymenobacter sp. BT175]|uniref:rhomboid family intramembrane serine protease n=1 Tax=Hymenobacter translucens TaxID=2886507 RepID=UPI001D0E6A2E|nr:rhomboid family intramembrane serine protease [Hymenobacter translucens]MCC2547862.1 rhomboid family intramembrane serine protease [Hymenobacter translucens]